MLVQWVVVASLLGISRKLLVDNKAESSLPWKWVKVGKEYHFWRADIAAWLVAEGGAQSLEAAEEMLRQAAMSKRRASRRGHKVSLAG